MGKTVGFLGGLLLGGLVGASAALLLTPQSGEKLRKQIRQHVNMVLEEGRRAAAERRAELEAQFAEAKRVPKSTLS